MSGVRAKGPNRIQFTIWYRGKRYRPTVARASTEANLRRARKQLEDIEARIEHGTFDFSEEFPDYRYIDDLPEQKLEQAAKRTCNQLFDAFLRHCQMRVASKDMAFSTCNAYRKILARSWRPHLGDRELESVVYSELVEIASSQGWKTKKTYNNGISSLRRAFEFGYKDLPDKAN